MAAAFPFFTARGSHRDLGRQHGEQCRTQLLGLLDWLAAALRLARDQLQERALRFLPLFEQHCPHLVEEVRGLGEGAGVPFAEALAVQLRGELGQVNMGGCTTFVIGTQATEASGILIGQNSDLEPGLEALTYVLRLEPKDKPAILMWTFGGQIGYHGLNAAGVAHFANSLGGGPAWRFALSHYPVKRMMLEQRSLDGIVQMLGRTPVCSSGNYVLCDGGGKIADIELTPAGFEMVAGDPAGFLVHANHFLCGAHACAANHAASLRDSFSRQDRMAHLVGEKAGRLAVEDMKRFLADHDGFPTSLCRHPHEGPDHPSVSSRGYTTGSIIAEPMRGKMHICRGNPCTGEYVTYALDGGVGS